MVRDVLPDGSSVFDGEHPIHEGTPKSVPTRQSTIPCPRCPMHTRCYATHWCEACFRWMCTRCAYACNVGPQPHGTPGLSWLPETLRFLATTGKQPDGGYVLYCGGLDNYAHLDGGEPYWVRYFEEPHDPDGCDG